MKPKKKPINRDITFRCSDSNPDIIERMRKEAKRRKRSTNSLIELAIVKFLETEENKGIFTKIKI